MGFEQSTMEAMERLNGKVNSGFWKGKRIFLTGHTGFKGSWLSLWLYHLGAHVKGYALEPNTDPALFTEAKVKDLLESEIGDIRDFDSLRDSMSDFEPEIVIHMAAQPLVRRSYSEPKETYSTNVMGTVNVLESAKSCKNLKALVSVTTDKCYENKEWEWGYRENEPMGGYDPYSSSKACAELVTSAYRNSFFADSKVAVASARAGNVIGGGDWSEDRLVPDILRAFKEKRAVMIRNPLSTRPWQHVLEPLSGYLVLAEALYHEGNNYAEAWNFGPKDEDCRPVNWILDNMVALWGDNAEWTLDKNSNPHEAAFLKLDCSKAKKRLNWEPKWDLEHTLGSITTWHKDWVSGKDVQKKCINEIETYSK